MILPCHHPYVRRAPYTNAKDADENAIELMSARFCLCPANRRSSVNPQSYDDELAYEIKSNRGLRSRLSALCQGQGGKGHRVSIFNETHDVVSLVALPGSTLFSRTTGVAAGGFLEAVVGQWKTNKLKTFDRNDTVAFQVPPGQRCSVKQWDGMQDIVVLVATFGKSRYEEHGGDFEPDERSLLSVWAKLRCNVGATVFLYPGLFHPNMRPLFGRHVLDENTPAAHVIVDVVLPR